MTDNAHAHARRGRASEDADERARTARRSVDAWAMHDAARPLDGAVGDANRERRTSGSDATSVTVSVGDGRARTGEGGGQRAPPGAFAMQSRALAEEEKRVYETRRTSWEALAREAREKCAQGTLRDVWLRERLSNITRKTHEGERTALMTDYFADADDRVAVEGVDGVRRGMTHRELRVLIDRVCEKDMPEWGVRAHGGRIAVVVPNGPELMTSLMCVLQRHCAVPINPVTTQEEIEEELLNTNAKVLLYQRDGGKGDVKMRRLCKKLKLTPLIITPSPTVAGDFTLVGDPYGLATEEDSAGNDIELMQADRLALILHTSGSTGKKKVVPIAMSQILIGAAAIAASCGLNEDDICCNFMPLFHVGGILRNVLAPIMSGGSTVAMPFFDVDNFWEVLESKKCTWYYGAPTMHMLIVKSAETMAKNDKGSVKTCVRFVANAAGPLQPATATELRRLFNNASVLPSYGMTECMPISCPPMGYALERPGTSGRSIGPEIGIIDDSGNLCPSGAVGNIMVRGPLVLTGYEGEAPGSSGFEPGGWFNTGDMGRMDDDGYLYVTGRTKEVINRGGEIISPVEIEEALASLPAVSECVAISVPHGTLQEVVGVLVVPVKGGQVPGMRQIVQHVAKRLPPSKWPQCLILASGIPKSITGKVSRSVIARQLRLPSLEDGMRELETTFEADFADNALSGAQALNVDNASAEVVQALLRVPGVNDAGAWMDSTGSIIAVVTPKTLDASSVSSASTRYLPGYLEPKEILPVASVPRDTQGAIEVSKVYEMMRQDLTDAPANPNQELLAHLWGEVLGTDSSMISIKDDFFLSGGSSIAAGQLAGLIRKKFEVNITGADMFELRTIQRIAQMIDKRTKEAESSDSKPTHAPRPVGPVDWVTPKSSSGIIPSIVQLMPLYLIKPFYNMTRWVLFLMCWSHVFHYLGPSLHWMRREHFMAKAQKFGMNEAHSHFYSTVQLLSFFVAIFFVALIVSILFPLSAIVFKWVVLGRLQAGSYPLWGQYYLRWFLVEQVTKIAGLGIFDLSPWLFTWYMRMMGASIGKSSYVSPKAIIGDFDLITIEKNTTVDEGCNIRAFEARRGGMRLSPIFIGEGCTLCVHAVCGPGAYVPAGSTLAAFTSWREMDPQQVRPVSTKTAQMHSETPRLASRLFVAFPIVFTCFFVRWLPWVLVLRVVQQHSIGDNLLTHAGMANWRQELDTLDNDYDALEVFVTLLGRLSWTDCIEWFMDPFRLGCIALARLMHATAGPFVQLFATILVKRLIVGKFKSGGLPQTPAAREWELTRRYIMRKLCPNGKFYGATDLLGKHYKYTTYIYRALGATVGERIFWPGSGVIVGDGMYDLLHIEDDVVWGSRSAVYPADTIGALPIRIRRGANISDRCVIFGGVTVMPNACLGSGSVAARKMTIASGSIWVGSRNGVAVQLDPGGASSMMDERQTAKPFGRATYLGQATYPVVPWYFMPVICISVQIFKAAANMLPIYAAWYATAYISRVYLEEDWQTLDATRYLSILFVVFLILRGVQTTFNLVNSVFLKWIIIGRRTPGNYPWDTSSYCFRWKLCDIMSDTTDLMLLSGSEHLCRYFRAKGANIGRNVCLYPTGADPPMPEPDLVTIGDGACINFAHVIAHTNTLGAFALNNILIRERSTLCMESRVMGGTKVGADSILLEHTLAMVGDDVERGGIWQGWPVQMVLNSCDRPRGKSSPSGPEKASPMAKSYGAM